MKFWAWVPGGDVGRGSAAGWLPGEIYQQRGSSYDERRQRQARRLRQGLRWGGRGWGRSVGGGRQEQQQQQGFGRISSVKWGGGGGSEGSPGRQQRKGVLAGWVWAGATRWASTEEEGRGGGDKRARAAGHAPHARKTGGGGANKGDGMSAGKVPGPGGMLLHGTQRGCSPGGKKRAVCVCVMHSFVRCWVHGCVRGGTAGRRQQQETGGGREGRKRSRCGGGVGF